MGAPSRRGMTLPELLTGMAIIGLSVTFAAPSLRKSNERYSLRSESLTVSRLMNYARSEAVATRKFVAVEFDMQAYPLPDRIRVIGDAEWNGTELRWEGTDVAGDFTHMIEAPNDLQELRVGGTTFSTGVHSLVFSPTGACGVDSGSLKGELEVDIVRMDV